MAEQQHETTAGTESNPSPAALSLVGGFVGTISGLKRNGVPGAVVGGLIGGTVGYVGGASLDDGATAGPEVDTEPVSVTVADEDDETDAESETTDETEASEDEDASEGDDTAADEDADGE